MYARTGMVYPRIEFAKREMFFKARQCMEFNTKSHDFEYLFLQSTARSDDKDITVDSFDLILYFIEKCN